MTKYEGKKCDNNIPKNNDNDNNIVIYSNNNNINKNKEINCNS